MSRSTPQPFFCLGALLAGLTSAAMLVMGPGCQARRPDRQLAPAAAGAGANAGSSASTAPASAPPEAMIEARPCDPWPRTFWLTLTPRSPALRAKVLVELAKRGATAPSCTSGAIYVPLTGAQLHAMLESHLELAGVPGAGNAAGACGWLARITPPRFVPGFLMPLVSSLQVDTDPKLELVRDLGACG